MRIGDFHEMSNPIFSEKLEICLKPRLLNLGLKEEAPMKEISYHLVSITGRMDRQTMYI